MFKNDMDANLKIKKISLSFKISHDLKWKKGKEVHQENIRFIPHWRYVETLQKYRVEFEKNLRKLYRSEGPVWNIGSCVTNWSSRDTYKPGVLM